MVPRVGQRIGPYEILGDLGSGGMGLVFSAWDSRLQRDVAIKLLRDEYCTPDMRSRFLQEARAASGLNHPNICTIFDIGEQGGDPYLVMELLKGETLRTRILTERLSVEDMVRVATETADALTVAHARGIIHRDIKPANIILVDKPGGRFGTKVLDFGLAKVDMGEGLDVRYDLTSAGATVGTVSYMSPEQARGEALDARSDLFSLGVVMYEMATGEMPFKGATSALVFVHLLSNPPEPVRQLNGAIPKKLEKVILKLLAKERGQRFQSASELVEALHEVAAKPSVGRSLWDAIPALRLGRESTARPSRPNGIAPSGPGKPDVSPRNAPSTGALPKTAPPRSEVPVERPKPAGESILRPVHRIASSHPSMGVRPAGERGLSESSRPSGFAVRPAARVETAQEAGGGTSSSPEEVAAEIAAEAPPPIQIPRPLPPTPMRTMQYVDENGVDVAKADEPVAPPAGHWGFWSWVLTVALLVLIVAGIWRFRTGQMGPGSGQPSVLVLGSLTNHTGDAVLSGVLLKGLEFDLRQSPRFAVRDADALSGSLHALDLPAGQQPTNADARRAAQAIGGTELLFGDVENAGASYVVSLRVYEVGSGSKIVDVSETAVSREQLPDALDRLAFEVRSGLGESGDAIGKTSIPLNKEASSNLDAMAAYVSGTELVRSGHFVEAMHALENATTLDPHFTQAYLWLAELYSRQHAGVAAAAAAVQAQNNGLEASLRTRLMSQVSYAMNGSGDLERAGALLQQVLAAYPGDAAAAVVRAGLLSQEGKYAESLEVSQRVLQADPYNTDAAWAAETALLALDRPETAAQVEAQAQRAGADHPGLRLLTNYLGSREDGQLAVDLSGQTDHLMPRQYEATVLDAGGLLQGGLQEWRAIAARASANPELMSGAGEALASAALDRALVEDCPTAQELLRDAMGYPQAADALFAAGMASALCGDLETARKNTAILHEALPQSFAAKGYYVPDLTAAIQWKGGDPVQALTTLEAARTYDLISLTAYLRGIVHLKSGEPKAAVSDFQGMLEHRGATTLANPVLFAMAQIGQARAYEASGDHANGAAAYRKFLVLWSAADEDLGLVREARAGAGAVATQ